MNKHSLLGIVSIVVIGGTIGYGFLNSFFAENLEFRWAGVDDFNLFSLVYGGMFEACNPSSFPVSFRLYTIQVINGKENLGIFVLDGGQVPPMSSKVFTGKFNSDSQTLAGVTSLLIDTELKGRDVMRLDAKQVYIITSTQTNILGFIPYTVSKQYSGYDYLDMMSQQSNCSK